jgi:hypothetical protein
LTISDSDELQRLRSCVGTLEDDKRVLEERLGFAWQEVGRLRAGVLEARTPIQTAAPGYRRVEVETVTAAEPADVLGRPGTSAPDPACALIVRAAFSSFAQRTGTTP